MWETIMQGVRILMVLSGVVSVAFLVLAGRNLLKVIQKPNEPDDRWMAVILLVVPVIIIVIAGFVVHNWLAKGDTGLLPRQPAPVATPTVNPTVVKPLITPMPDAEVINFGYRELAGVEPKPIVLQHPTSRVDRIIGFATNLKVWLLLIILVVLVRFPSLRGGILRLIRRLLGRDGPPPAGGP